jgi:1-hydroxycarotenoid 3,4-desaturase
MEWLALAAPRITIIGAGMGGLAAAISLAARDLAVTVIDAAAAPGGKLREVSVGGRRMDAGPSVLTLRAVFDELFAAAGTTLDGQLRLTAEPLLARHYWDPGQRLDLHADTRRTTAAIGDFAGLAAAREFQQFSSEARRVFNALERSYMRAQRPSVLGLAIAILRADPRALLALRPFTSLWSALSRRFSDPRLRQLFARYATYCGSSPWMAPATLMLVAQAEAAGVWIIDGGLYGLARALADAAGRMGVAFRYQRRAVDLRREAGGFTVTLADGDALRSDAVVFNGDVAALHAGLLGAQACAAVGAAPSPRLRSLSAVTWNMLGAPRGVPLAHHTVFFSRDYAREFRALEAGTAAPDPTVYLCAQDRNPSAANTQRDVEPLFCLVNAPACGASRPMTSEDLQVCEQRMWNQLGRCGLRIEAAAPGPCVTTPTQFAQLYPGTDGALYGSATHGWRSSFTRPASRTRLPGLYLAGGSAHPGPGLPMAALSGRLAAAALLADWTSRSR